ncbi:MAG: hypothetical protein JWN32_1325, partial [Solirubrobacterales bacterium]|nr:hypothetical protein [Solirubrobacterales bacterium]
AVNAGNWARATLLVNNYNDLDLVGRLRFIQGKGAAAMTAAAAAATAQGWDDNHRVRRGLAFLQVETQVGPTARPASPATGWTLGTGGTAVAVTGGTVTAYSAVASGGGTANWYALQYQGTNAQNTGWIQFISREIERFDAATGGASLGFYIPPGALTHLGQPGTVTYGTATAPNWYVDTFSNTLPFYESPVQTPAGGAALPAWAQPVGTRGGNISVPDTPATPASPGHPATAAVGGQTTMIDNPGTVASHVTAAFAPVTVPGTAAPKPVLRVEARARCHESLVRGQEFLYEHTVVVPVPSTSAAGAAPLDNPPGAGGAANKLRTPHYQALIRRFPQFTYFPH